MKLDFIKENTIAILIPVIAGLIVFWLTNRDCKDIIRGNIHEYHTGNPVTNVSVYLKSQQSKFGSITNENGSFKLEIGCDKNEGLDTILIVRRGHILKEEPIELLGENDVTRNIYIDWDPNLE